MPARILVIEDNATNLNLMAYLIQAFGHTVLTAVDGEEGLEFVERESPELIVCDVELPKLSGYEVARRLKRHPTLRAIPLVAVTAFAMVDDRDKVLAAGFDGYIPKPIEPETFVGQIEAFLHSGPATNAPPPKLSTCEFTRFRAKDKEIAILVVDNSPENLQLMRSTLEPYGYTVIAVRSVDEALAYARQAPPDLIISDLHMPHSGYDFLTTSKSDPVLGRIPFIFLSSTMLGEEDARRAMSQGAARFLMRPIEPLALLAQIEACLQE